MPTIMSSAHPAYLRITKGGRWGLIDLEGRFVLPPCFDFISAWSDGFAAVVQGGKQYVLRDTGDLRLRKSFDIICDFHDGLAPAKQGEKWGYIDGDANWIIEPTFAVAKEFSEGLAYVVREDGSSGYVNKRGQMVIPLEAPVGHYKFRDGLAVYDRRNKEGFINRKGEVEIEARFYGVHDFSEGLAVVSTKNGAKSGAIDRHGNPVIPEKFFNILPSSEGLMVASPSSTKPNGYLDATGAWAIEPRFSGARSFSGGLACAAELASVINEGFIDRSGEFVIKPMGKHWASVSGFQGDLCEIHDDHHNGRVGWLHRSGDWLWKPG